MKVAKERGPEGADPIAVTLEPDDAEGQTSTVPSQDGHADQVAPRRRGVGRAPVWVVVEAAVVVVVLVVALATRSGDLVPATASTQQLVTVTRGTLSTTVSAQGTVAAANTANLSFTAAGTVTAVNVNAGDMVTAGQVLATVNSAALQAAVASAQATLTSAQAKVSDDGSSGASAAQLAADQAALTSDNDALGEAQTALAGASLVAPFSGEVAQVNVTAGEQLSSGGTGGSSLTGSGSGSGRSSSAIGSGSGSGTGLGGAGAGAGAGTGAGGGAGTGTGGAGSTASSSSSSSSSSSPAVEVITPGSYTASLPVSSADIGSVAVGQSATLTVTTATNSSPFGGGLGGFLSRLGLAGGGGSSSSSRSATGATATGTVTAASKVATASSGVAQYPVTVTFNAPQTGFYVGASVIGAIATNAVPNVILVPTNAVTTTNGKSTVVVATKGTLSGPTETQVVTTGPSSNGFVEITSGLKEGEQIVATSTTLASSAAGSTSAGSGATSPGGTGGTSGAGG
jgi:macrolide-specific efflux system membrane fusion protein